MYADEDIRLLAGSAKRWVSGCYIYFTPVDITNTDHLLALLELERQLGEAAKQKGSTVFDATDPETVVISRLTLSVVSVIVFAAGVLLGVFAA